MKCRSANLIRRTSCSVIQRAARIARHLAARPIRARRETLGYRAAKLVRRQPLLVAAASLLAVTLVAGVATTAWQARSTRRERQRLELLAHDINFYMYNAVRPLPGTTAVLRTMFEKALGDLDSTACDDADDPGLLRELAVLHRRIANVQGNPRLRTSAISQGRRQASAGRSHATKRSLRAIPPTRRRNAGWRTPTASTQVRWNSREIGQAHRRTG